MCACCYCYADDAAGGRYKTIMGLIIYRSFFSPADICPDFQWGSSSDVDNCDCYQIRSSSYAILMTLLTKDLNIGCRPVFNGRGQYYIPLQPWINFHYSNGMGDFPVL